MSNTAIILLESQGSLHHFLSHLQQMTDLWSYFSKISAASASCSALILGLGLFSQAYKQNFGPVPISCIPSSHSLQDINVPYFRKNAISETYYALSGLFTCSFSFQKFLLASHLNNSICTVYLVTTCYFHCSMDVY